MKLSFSICARKRTPVRKSVFAATDPLSTESLSVESSRTSDCHTESKMNTKIHQPPLVHASSRSPATEERSAATLTVFAVTKPGQQVIELKSVVLRF